LWHALDLYDRAAAQRVKRPSRPRSGAAMREFEGKVAVVTGAASGIGRAMADRFAAEGMRVVLADIEEPALEAAVAELRQQEREVIGVCADTSSYESVQALAQRALDEFGGVHIMCNNAGVGGGGRGEAIWERSLNDWNWTFGINWWGVVYGIKTFVPTSRLRSGPRGGQALVRPRCAPRSEASMRRQVNIGVSNSVYDEDSESRSSRTSARNSPG
jgi:NAD(P)-dependent dehydrogenase (short-subunit alcohol dehydrogenase family)